MSNWTRAEAFLLCRLIEQVAVEYDLHIALTGGLLYKSDNRKDLDIVVYHVRKSDSKSIAPFLNALVNYDIVIENSYGFVTKAKWNGKTIDFLYPEYNADAPSSRGGSYK